MKTKELIKQLQEEDPSGELEVEIGGHAGGAINGVSFLPGHYDGWVEYLEKDESGEQKYVLNYTANKVRIYWHDLANWAFEYVHRKKKEDIFKLVVNENDKFKEDHRKTLQHRVDEAWQKAEDIDSGKIEE